MNHTPHTWTTGDVIQAGPLNTLEQDLAAAAVIADIPTPGTPTGDALRAAFVAYAPQPSGGDDTIALQSAMTAAAGKTLQIPAGTYLITAGLTLPLTASLILTKGAVIKANATIAGPMLTAGTLTTQRMFGSITGGTWNCNSLAQTGIFVPWHWGERITDVIIQDHTGHGLVIGSASASGVSAQHKIIDVELYSSAGRTAPVGSYGVYIALSSDGVCQGVTVSSAETSFRTDSPSNRFISCHGWYSGGGYNKVCFDDATGNNDWIGCEVDTPSQYGFVLRGYWSRIVGGFATLGSAPLDNVPIAIHCATGGSDFEGLISGFRVIGNAAARWAKAIDINQLPYPGLTVIGCSTLNVVGGPSLGNGGQALLDSLSVFNTVRLSTTNGGPTLSGGAADPNGIISGAAGDIWFRTNATGTANSRVYVCTGSTTWTGIA